MNAADLRSLIIRAIGNQLGSYRLPGGGMTPAIAVLPDPDVGYTYPPQGTDIIGIEARVHLPLNDLHPLIGNTPMISPRWELRLLQRDPSRSAISAANDLLPALSTALNCEVSQPRLIPANPEKSVPEQVVIFLTERGI